MDPDLPNVQERLLRHIIVSEAHGGSLSDKTLEHVLVVKDRTKDELHVFSSRLGIKNILPQAYNTIPVHFHHVIKVVSNAKEEVQQEEDEVLYCW